MRERTIGANKEMRVLILLVFICISHLTAFGQEARKFGVDNDQVPAGIEVGEQAPLFTAFSSDGEQVKLEEVLKNGPVVLVFYRGAWCPYCVRYLLNLSDSIDQIISAGAEVYAITPQQYQHIKGTDDKTGGRITIMHDKDGMIMDRYMLSFDVTDAYVTKIKAAKQTDISKSNGQSSAELPIPATYVIDKSGKIVYRHFDVNYKKRPSVKAIVSALDKL